MKKVIIALIFLVNLSVNYMYGQFTIYTPASSVYSATVPVYPGNTYRSPSTLNNNSYTYGSTVNGTTLNSNVYAYPNVTYQNGYTRKDGTYVQGHYKTRRNNTNWDNFSTSGNTNPFTNKAGSVARDYSVDAYNYGSGQTIHTGPKGGQYYINSNGNKTYVPKRNSRNTITW